MSPIAWFKVDDGFSGHRKVMALRRGAERLRAIGLWTLAGSWSAEQGLGGFMPEHMIDQFGATQKDVDALIRVGLWERVSDDETAFHDWDHYQPDAATVAAQRLAQRQKESESGRIGNHRRWHEARGIAVIDCEFCHRVPDENAVGDPIGSASGQHRVAVAPYPNPYPIDVDADASTSRKRPSRAKVDRLARPEVAALCDHLADRIEGNGSKRPTVTGAWLTAGRLMLDSDGRTEDEIRRAIDWCQADQFWRANVLSMPKLREKYDQMRLSASRTATPPPRKNDIDWDAAVARAAARQAEPDRKELA